tara:strand:+ start:172 stop:465 length:294 start_codon:yes stop_codon:yes gene_type:complete
MTDAVTVGSANGVVALGGLPFAVTSGNDMYCPISLSEVSGWAGDHPISGTIAQSASFAYLFYRSSVNGAFTDLAVADVATGANANKFRFQATYYTNL